MSGKILVVVLFFINFIYAGVVVTVDKKVVIKGDSLTIKMSANGNNIKFPKIDKIDGYRVESVSNSKNISYVNGKFNKEETLFLVITPDNNLTIPSFKVLVNGKEQDTKPIKISVIEDKNLKNNFMFKVIKADKIYQNYPNSLIIKFYKKTNQHIDDLSLQLPKGDFKLKQVGKIKNYFSGVYEVQEIHYIFVPHKAGNSNLTFILKIGKESIIDNYGFITRGIKYKTLRKTLNINVRPLNYKIVGDYKISMKVDKTTINSNKPLNVVLNISGYGDLSNLSDIKLNIDGVTIFDDKKKIKEYIKDKKIFSEYSKKFVILASNSYTIPSVSFKFYSLEDNKIKSISTKEIKIEVLKSNNSINNNLDIKFNNKSKVIKVESINYIYIIISFLMGVLVTIIVIKLFNKKEIFKMPNNLYKNLLPFADNPKIREILYKLDRKEKLNKSDKNIIKEILS